MDSRQSQPEVTPLLLLFVYRHTMYMTWTVYDMLTCCGQGSARAEAAESDRPSPHDPSTGRDKRSRVLGGGGGEAAARAD